MKIQKIFFIAGLSLLLMVTACGSRKDARTQKNSASMQEQAVAGNQKFTVPDLPSYLQGEEAQIDFIVTHFWDHLDCRDTVMLSQNLQAMAEYISFLNQVPLEKGQTSIRNFLQKTASNPDLNAYVLDKLNIFLMDPNSMVRNDELYEPVCEYIMAHADEMDPARFQAELDLKFIRINRRGTVASDFTAQDLRGRRVSMHSIRSPYTFVIFYNPDCHGCDETMEYIKNSTILNSEPVQAVMKVVAVYVDQSAEIWERAKEMIPDNWISLWDKNGKLRQEEIYDLKAIPTLYLLDENKKILLKDANLPDVENYFVKNLLE